MRVPLAWLRSYCDPGSPAAEIADALTMSGDKLERLDRVGVGDDASFVIGRVLESERHPDADRLSVCVVDDGSGEPRTIVCGAPNVAAGQTVAVALPGAIMPDGTKLGEAKLRGVKSSGMILAEDEVGIGTDHAGIMVLDDGLAPGEPLAAHLPISDEVLELEVTPNRPDVMSVYGVARDLHAVTGAALAADPTDEDPEPSGDDDAGDHASIEIDPEICLRFTARVFEDVKVGPSPLWLKQRLLAAGQRPISNVVDITNYVMLTTGQPLHAFDLDRVRGGRIVVRRASAGETMTTLDDVERTFSSEMALVCDAEGPSGIAGVMGGQISEVSDDTTRVLMEAATWVGPNIMRTSKALGLRSEASARFEKQLHPEQAIAAQRLAARLMVELAGARLVPGTLDEYPAPREPRVVPLRLDRIERLLGERIEAGTVEEILTRLGFEQASGGWVVPPWRDSDVQREVDLIEEVARVHGLHNLPTTLPARRAAVGRLTEPQRLRRRLEDALRDRGLSETVSYSFTAPRSLSRLSLDGEPPLRLDNPLSEEQSVMRPLLLPGLLDAAAHNTAHGRDELALFESARTFRSAGAIDDGRAESPGGAMPAAERHHLAALQTVGRVAGWRTPGLAADFYSVRALVDALLETAGIEWRAEPGALPFLHPGRQASVLAGDTSLGFVGELHPEVAAAWELERPVAVLELDLDALGATGADVYRDVTSVPAVRQDIAVVVPEEVPAARVEDAVRAGGGDLLESLAVFDLYRGDQVGPGRKSLALRLEFRAPDRTLTDEEVAERRAAIEREVEALGVGSVPDTRVAVLGATGFGGALCAHIVDRHPSLELTVATARAEAGRRHDELYPRYAVRQVLEQFDANSVAERADAALVAYPHKTAALAVKQLRERGLKVVDLSADFRLDQAAYERWYQPHEAPELLGEAVYGLPEAHREEIAAASLVAGPGCNSTAAILAALPLRGRIEDAVFDIKAGVSGAGREATEETHYSSAAENVNAYKVEGHRHSAEIEQELGPGRFSFLTHLVPLDQGILASCYLTVPGLTKDEATELYRAAYADEPFVDVVDSAPHTRHVQDTNRCRVHVTVVDDRTIAFGAIDNLWKGAAGQAVQDLNLMLGLPETEGLT